MNKLNPSLRAALTAAALVGCVAVAAKSSKIEDRIEVVTEGGIGKTWAAAPGASFPAPGYPAAMKDRAANVCVSIGYTLSKDGVPSDLSLLQSWSRDRENLALTDAELEPFVQAAAGALTQWRFTPKDGTNHVPTTYTSATMTFNGAAETRPKSLPAECRIADLQAYVAKQGNEGQSRVNKNLLDRMEIQGRQARQAAYDARYTNAGSAQ